VLERGCSRMIWLYIIADPKSLLKAAQWADHLCAYQNNTGGIQEMKRLHPSRTDLGKATFVMSSANYAKSIFSGRRVGHDLRIILGFLVTLLGALYLRNRTADQDYKQVLDAVSSVSPFELAILASAGITLVGYYYMKARPTLRTYQAILGNIVLWLAFVALGLVFFNRSISVTWILISATFVIVLLRLFEKRTYAKKY